jgi:hypothetical protein
MNKRLLVTGCGRSGTKYISILLKRAGLDIGHERMGGDGICSWLFGADAADTPWGPAPSEYRFDYIFHLVRHPLSAIPSIATFKGRAWDYISRHIDIDKDDPVLLRSAKYWLYWNAMVEDKTSDRIRIEDMPDAIDLVCGSLGIDADISELRTVPTDINTRRMGKLFHVFETRCLDLGIVSDHSLLKKALTAGKAAYSDLSWEDLEALDPSVAAGIRGRAEKYGY